MQKYAKWKEEDDNIKISGQLDEKGIYIKLMPKVCHSNLRMIILSLVPFQTVFSSLNQD